MKTLTHLFSRRSRTFHFVLIAALSLALVFGPEEIHKRASGVLLGTLYLPFCKLDTALTDFAEYVTVKRNYALDKADRKIRLILFEDMYDQNRRLRQMQGFAKRSQYKVNPVEVQRIWVECGIPQVLTINKGTGEGIRENQAVVSEDGLLGRISESGSGWAKVQLLTDPSNRVSAKVIGSGQMGIVTYSVNRRSLVMAKFSRADSIAVGDTVITSGLGGSYPPGLLVGTVDSVESGAHDSWEVMLTPAADFGRLAEIFVVIEEEP